ncbi:MAG: gamma-glutamylcyclotransferase [Tepidamorphaceae bacterium]|nr:gamma-glutamylcyclotransferase [Rhodobiaceae bacterium]MCC0049133.1 gamma-glutamylcyclotransferase [Rhodobiaceae bacterium]
MHETNWVFGYGSLMWRPGFDYAERVGAHLAGAHRRLCVYSHVHRGTPEKPGLVLGLDRGGACHGVAFRVEPDAWDSTIAYLRAREQVTMVYREAIRPIRLADGRRVAAVAYLVDRKHEQYAGKLPIGEQTVFVRQGVGQSGPNGEYVRNTLTHLDELGIHDSMLHALVARLDTQA